MKVIGKTEKGLLIDASEQELANIAGFAYAFHSTGSPWKDKREIPVGSEIPVSKIFDRLGALREGEAKLKDGAAHLRALATLMESQVPSVILPEPEFEEVEGSQ